MLLYLLWIMLLYSIWKLGHAPGKHIRTGKSKINITTSIYSNNHCIFFTKRCVWYRKRHRYGTDDWPKESFCILFEMFNRLKSIIYSSNRATLHIEEYQYPFLKNDLKTIHKLESKANLGLIETWKIYDYKFVFARE